MARQRPSRRGNRHYGKRIGYRFLIVRPFAQHQLVEPVPFSALKLVYRGLEAFEF
jgi:hypothetical protein